MKYLIILVLLSACAPEDSAKTLDTPDIETILTINTPEISDTCSLVEMSADLNGEHLYWTDELYQEIEVTEGSYIIEGDFRYTCDGGSTTSVIPFDVVVNVPEEGLEVNL